MQRSLAVLSIVMILSFLVGCGDDDPVGPGLQPPTDVTISVAAADSLSIQLSWTAVTTTVTAAADGYFIYFEGAKIDSTTTTSYTHTNPTLLGDYQVSSYQGNDESSGKSNTVSTNVVNNDTSPDSIFEFGSSNQSGYGWMDDGMGVVYSAISANQDSIDIMMDAGFRIRSPEDSLPGWNVTGIWAAPGDIYDTLSVAPSTGYANFQDPVQNLTYVLWIRQGVFYAKIHAITVGGTAPNRYVKFKYTIQPVKGFRKLG
jgi:hypothetical protein